MLCLHLSGRASPWGIYADRALLVYRVVLLPVMGRRVCVGWRAVGQRGGGMNRLLAEALNFLNGIIALVLVAGFTLGGYRVFPFIPNPWNFILGCVTGIVLAALICGMIAYVALIERHLSIIAKSVNLEHGSRRIFSADTSGHRREPTL